MRIVILEKTTCTINGEVIPLDYAQQLIGLISNPADGMNLAQMRNIEKVFDKLDAASCPGSILLEDAEHKTLKDVLEKAVFKVFNKDIKRMIESVIAAETVNIELLKDNKTG